MVTDSNTLALVLLKAASHSAGLEKEAGPPVMMLGKGLWGAAKGLAGSMRGWGSKVVSRIGNKGWQGVPFAAPAPKYPRFFNRTTPIEGSYLPGFRRMGGWLDQQANKGWGMRALTSIPRRVLPGKGLMNTGSMAGYGYGISSGVANRQLEPEFEAVGTNAAAQALIQQRQWAKEHWMQNALSPLASDQTVAEQLMQKSKPLAQAYWNQTQNPNHFTDVLQGIKQNHRQPWRSFF